MSWIWICSWHNGASHWADSDRCLASSRKPLKTKEAAEQALARHQKRARHQFWEGWGVMPKFGEVRQIHGNTKHL